MSACGGRTQPRPVAGPPRAASAAVAIMMSGPGPGGPGPGQAVKLESGPGPRPARRLLVTAGLRLGVTVSGRRPAGPAAASSQGLRHCEEEEVSAFFVW